MVFICSTVYRGRDLGPIHTVLIDGEYYVVGDHLLAALKRGITPAELELEPFEAEDDDQPLANALARHERSFRPGDM